jgi:hypothetical protein
MTSINDEISLTIRVRVESPEALEIVRDDFCDEVPMAFLKELRPLILRRNGGKLASFAGIDISLPDFKPFPPSSSPTTPLDPVEPKE